VAALHNSLSGTLCTPADAAILSLLDAMALARASEPVRKEAQEKDYGWIGHLQMSASAALAGR